VKNAATGFVVVYCKWTAVTAEIARLTRRRVLNWTLTAATEKRFSATATAMAFTLVQSTPASGQNDVAGMLALP